MATNTLKTTNGNKIALYRSYTANASLSSTQYLAPSVFQTGTGNADVSITGTGLTNPVIISGAATTKAFSTGYPQFDYTNMEVTIRCYLNTLEANDKLLDSAGLFNADTSALMSDVAKFTGQSKSNTDEFVYLFKMRLT